MNKILHTNAKPLSNKVPEITLYFWIIKILATTVGETAADFLNIDLHFGLGGTSIVMAGLLAAFLLAQLRAGRYLPSLYWVTVVLISIVGTLITDNLTDKLGIPLQTTTLVFSLALTVTFAIWYYRERTLSIHTIYTRRRELFYWAAILFTIAFGTAAGDLVAEHMSLGYANSALLFSAMTGAVALTYYAFRRNGVLAFWIAYILTRPLGAACGDFLSQPAVEGGLGMGTVQTSALFLAAIAGLVIYLSFTRKDMTEPRIAP